MIDTQSDSLSAATELRAPTGLRRLPRLRATRIGAVLGLACAMLWACGGSGGGSSPQTITRSAMLRSLADTVIVPTYEQLAVEATALAAAATALEGTPSAQTLTVVQVAWRATRARWKQSEAFAIGPAQTLRSAAKLDWSPTRPESIEREITGPNTLTAEYVEDLGATAKGFLALEYLLFDPDDPSAVLTKLGEPRRRAYLRALAENLRDQAERLRDAWQPGAGDFAATLADAGPGNPTFPTIKSAVDELVNQLVFLAEDIADTQLLAALGTRTGGTPRPEVLDAHRSENGLADVLDNLAGIENLYFGTFAQGAGNGFHDVVADLSPEIDDALTLAVTQAIASAERIPAPLEASLSSDRAVVEQAQTGAKELMARLEIDMVSVLGVTLRFNPNDGD